MENYGKETLHKVPFRDLVPLIRTFNTFYEINNFVYFYKCTSVGTQELGSFCTPANHISESFVSFYVRSVNTCNSM